MSETDPGAASAADRDPLVAPSSRRKAIDYPERDDCEECADGASKEPHRPNEGRRRTEQ